MELSGGIVYNHIPGFDSAAVGVVVESRAVRSAAADRRVSVVLASFAHVEIADEGARLPFAHSRFHTAHDFHMCSGRDIADLAQNGDLCVGLYHPQLVE